MARFRRSQSVVANQEQLDVERQFHDCYEAHYRSLHRYITRLSDRADEADDVTQEVFVALWHEMQSGAQFLNPRAWLYRVAGNLVINRFKARSRAHAHRTGVEEAARRWQSSPPNIERTTVQRQIVRRALKQLPEPMRQCLLLYHEGLTGREIAEVLGVKPSYVGTLVLRAHERFRHECEALGGSYDLLG